jgi:hypothetical protein
MYTYTYSDFFVSAANIYCIIDVYMYVAVDVGVDTRHFVNIESCIYCIYCLPANISTNPIYNKD